MAAYCPHCRQKLKVPGAKPGRYTSKCPNCDRHIVLSIPEEAGQEVAVSPQQEAPFRATPQMPATLGGYQILKKLGQGGMGTVYLARQLSLNREVALKVMNCDWTNDPRFLARFLREAHLAAQLAHHNIVQIYDVGQEGDIHFYSMELVHGHTLAEVLQSQGKLDPLTATNYILQAARGLQFAHTRGLIHRDIKPENLMLNEEGIVKVADLGLVKMTGVALSDPDTQVEQDGDQSLPDIADVAALGVTLVGWGMGTPAYIAPEQARNATNVDVRADIYSLGGTLYTLLTGRPPFAGDTALELMVKHISEPLIPPEQLETPIPPGLSRIVMKMMAKKPHDRHDNMAEVIRELDRFQSGQRVGGVSASEEEAAQLAELAAQFQDTPRGRLRTQVLFGFFASCLVLVFLSGLLGWIWLSVGFAGLMVLAPLLLFLVNGITWRTPLYLKVRQFLMESSKSDWIACAATMALLVLVVLLFRLFWIGMFFFVLAVLLAGAAHVYLERALRREQRVPLEKTQRLLHGLGTRGMREEEVREFVSGYAGESWEGLHEALFGYEAMIQARLKEASEDGETGHGLHLPWRDWLIQWIENKRLARQLAKQRQQSATAEAVAPQETTSSLSEQAVPEQPKPEVPTPRPAVAESVSPEVPVATSSPASSPAPPPAVPPATVPVPATPVVATPAQVNVILPGAQGSFTSSPTSPRRRGVGAAVVEALFEMVFGPKVRFFAGIALLVVFVLWLDQNKLVPEKQVQDIADVAAKQKEVSDITEYRIDPAKTKPLQVPGVPEAFTWFFNSINLGVAGLLLLLSAFSERTRYVMFLVPAVGVMLFGTALGVPEVGPVTAEYVCTLAGLAIAYFGYLFDRMTDER